jgi:hypothetical protein
VVSTWRRLLSSRTTWESSTAPACSSLQVQQQGGLDQGRGLLKGHSRGAASMRPSRVGTFAPVFGPSYVPSPAALFPSHTGTPPPSLVDPPRLSPPSAPTVIGRDEGSGRGDMGWQGEASVASVSPDSLHCKVVSSASSSWTRAWVRARSATGRFPVVRWRVAMPSGPRRSRRLALSAKVALGAWNFAA